MRRMAAFITAVVLLSAGSTGKVKAETLQWQKGFGSASYDEAGLSVAVAPGGSDVFLLATRGGGRRVVRLSQSGTPLRAWLAPGGQAVAAARGGAIYVAGTAAMASGSALQLKRFSPIGTLAWDRLFAPPGTVATGQTVAIDASGCVYAAGHALPTTVLTTDNFLVAKYSPGGDRLWSAQWQEASSGGPVHSRLVTGVAVDGAGDVFVAGWASSSFFSTPVVSKIGRNGALAWSLALPPIAAGKWAGATGIAIGRDGYLYVSGFQWVNSLGGGRIWKLGKDGKLVWARAVTALGGVQVSLAAITVSPGSGDLYVGGQTTGTPSTSTFHARYSTGGVALWRTTRPAGKYPSVWGIAAAADGSLYSTGAYRPLGRTDRDVFLLKFR